MCERYLSLGLHFMQMCVDVDASTDTTAIQGLPRVDDVRQLWH